MIVITNFHELHAPSHHGGGGSTGNNTDWCTYDKDHHGVYYLLNDGNYILADLLKGLKHKEFYFDTEVECHEAAAEYYWKHQKKKYPYVNEWKAARAKMFNASSSSCKNNASSSRKDIESEVMEFI